MLFIGGGSAAFLAVRMQVEQITLGHMVLLVGGLVALGFGAWLPTVKH